MSDRAPETSDELGNEAFDFPPPERRIITQPYDLSLQTLREQWEQEELVVPEIQREYVWDPGRASRLVESMLLNIPVPPIYFAERKDSKLEIVDGHQRVRSIVRYMQNEFALSGLAILSEYGGKHFSELPEHEQRYLKTRSLRAVVISRDSHPTMKFEAFERLNTGGIALNAQEVRNSIFRGSLNNMLRRLAKECTPFREMIGSTTPRKRMVDEELVLRWLAFRDGFKAYKPPLKRFMNEFMDENRDRNENWLAPRRDHFIRTMTLLNSVLAAQAFRLIDEDGAPLHDEHGKQLPRGLNRALFDAQSLAFSWIVDTEIPKAKRKSLLRTISNGLARPDLQDATRRATGDRARLRLRVRVMVESLDEAGIAVKIPSGVRLEDDASSA